MLKRIKKHSRTSPDVQFKEFVLTKQKTRPRTYYEWIGQTISKKSDKKQKIKVKMPHVNKKQLGKREIWFKQETRPNMNYEWIGKNHLGKKFDPKNWKNSKNQSEKITSDKTNFCSNIVFLLYFKIRVKNLHATIPFSFSIHFLFWHDQNHYSNLFSKIIKMSGDLKKQ